MSKSVSYSVVPRKNPQEPEAGVRFYAQAQASGDVTVREMSERIQRTCTVTRADVAAVLTALEDVIVEALSAGDKVKLVDFGSFEVRTRSARTARNPRTGEKIEIGEAKTPIFKAGKALKDSVNK